MATDLEEMDISFRLQPFYVGEVRDEVEF
jgi:hypothetical protein